MRTWQAVGAAVLLLVMALAVSAFELPPGTAPTGDEAPTLATTERIDYVRPAPHISIGTPLRAPVTYGEPVRWTLPITFNGTNHTVIYETPAVHESAVESSKAEGWTKDIFLWTRSTQPYANLTYQTNLSSTENLDVQPPLPYALSGSAMTLTIPTLEQKLVIRLTGDIVAQEGGAAPLLGNTTNGTLRAGNGTGPRRAGNDSGNGSRTPPVTVPVNLTNRTLTDDIVAPEAEPATAPPTGDLRITGVESMRGRVQAQFHERGVALRVRDLLPVQDANVTVNLTRPFPEHAVTYAWDGERRVPLYLSPDRRRLLIRMNEYEDGVLNGEVRKNLTLILPNFTANVTMRGPQEARATVDGRDLAVRTDAGTITQLRFVEPESTKNPPRQRFAQQLIKFTVEDLEDGVATIDVELDTLPRRPQLWKFNPRTGDWYRFPFEQVDEKTVRLTLTDGGPGDDDGLVNGIIEDDLGITSGWWNDNWQWRLGLNISNTATTLTNYTVHIEITDAEFNFSRAKDNLSDVRFTVYNSTSDTETRIIHQLVSGEDLNYSDGSLTARFLVKIPTLPAGEYTTIFLYSDNPSAESVSTLPLGNATHPARNCNELYRRVQNITSGNYYIDPNQNGTDYQYVYCDMGLNNTGWTLLYNYNHTGGTSPGPTEGTWPTNHGGFSHEDNIQRHGYALTDIWGLRFRCNTSGHGRVVHFHNSDPDSIQGVLDDTTSVGVADVANDDYKFADHTGFLPDAATQDTGENEPGEALFGPGFPMYLAGTYHWSAGEPNRGSPPDRWECDDYPNDDAEDTLHQIWLEGNTTHPLLNPLPSVVALGPEYGARLNVTVDQPPQNAELLRSSPTSFNGTVDCLVADCGNVTVRAEYFTVSTPLQTFTDTSEADYTNRTASTNISITSTLTLEPLSDDWWNLAWPYRQRLIIDAAPENLTDYSMLLTLNNTLVGPSFNWVADEQAVRFRLVNLTTNATEAMSYYVRNWSSSLQEAMISLLIPNITQDGNVTVDLYYGNPAASSESALTIGSLSHPGKNCNDIYRRTQNAQDGNYYIDPDEDGTALQYVYCDMGLNNTGWDLLYNYDHVGGTSPGPTEGVWPTDNTSFSHQDGISAFGFSLTNILGLRFRCNTSGHGRVVHYHNSDPDSIQGVLDDTTSVGVADVANDDYKFADHTGFLPDAATQDTGENEPGEALFGPGFPMYLAGTYHWSAGEPNRGSPPDRWECDDYPGDDDEDTLHQIYLEGNTSAPLVFSGLNVTAGAESVVQFTPLGNYQSKVFNTGFDQTQLVNFSWYGVSNTTSNVTMFVRTAPGLSNVWWNTSYENRIEINISNTAKDLEEYQVFVERNFSTDYANSNITEGCTDVRFTWLNGSSNTQSPIPHYTDTCNLTADENATFWAQVPFLENDTTTKIFLYYGNPSAPDTSSINETFNYTTPKTVAYIVNNNTVNNGLRLVSLADNNDVYVGSSPYSMSKLGQETIVLDIDVATPINATKPIHAEGGGDTDSEVVPASWASTLFLYAGMRDNQDTLCYLSPWGVATVDLYDNGGASVATHTVNQSGFCELRDLTDGETTRIESDIPILVTHHGGTSQDRDSWAFYPATTEPLWGAAISTQGHVAAGTAGADITCDGSDGSQGTDSIGADDDYDCSADLGAGQNGSAEAWRVTTTSGPIGAIQQADSDGAESTVLVPQKEMGTLFGSAEALQYFAAATPYNDTNCTIYDGGGKVASKLSDGNGTAGVYKLCIGCLWTSTLSAGPWYAKCSAPVWPYYEEDSDDDETGLLGEKQMRQYVHPEPSLAQGVAKDYTDVITDYDSFEWTSWFQQANSTAVQAPDGRYVQYHAFLETGDVNETPTITSVEIGFRQLSTSWTAMAETETTFTTTNPFDCGITTVGSSCSATEDIVPRSVGNYSLRLVALSNNDLVIEGISLEHNVSVWLQPVLSTFTSSQDPAISGEATVLSVTLLDDAAQPLSGYTINFTDQTGNGSLIKIGTNTTDASGVARITYALPADSLLQTHTLNASYAGDSAVFYRPADLTTTLLVSSRPNISAIDTRPASTGFGLNITITANITDGVGLDEYRINYTDEGGTATLTPLTAIGNDQYQFVFNDSWTVQDYTFHIIANNTDGVETVSSEELFSIAATANTTVVTTQDGYANNKIVYIDMERDWHYKGWARRVPFAVENTAGELEEYQIQFSAALGDEYTSGRIQEDCADVRFTWYNTSAADEEAIDYFVDSCNLADADTATFWAQVPVLANDTNTTVYLYYGNRTATSASNITATFSYSRPRTVAYVVSQRIVDNNLDIISYEDGNNVTVDGTDYPLDNLSTETNVGGLSLGTVINATKPFSAEGRGDVDDMVVPISWASTLFHFGGQRDNTDRYCLLSPFGTATVDIYDGNGLWQDDLSVDDTGTCVSKDVPDGNATRVESDLPVLVFRDGTGQNRDSYPFYPATSDPLYGPSLSDQLYFSAGASSASVTIANHTGESVSLAVTAGLDANGADEMGNGEDGGGPAVRLTASTPLGAIQQADSDGSDASILVPEKEMSQTFGSVYSAEYIVAVSTAPVNCTLYTSSGKFDSNLSVGSGGVHKLGFTNGIDPGVFITGPWKMVCSRPVWAYFDSDDNSDETTMLGEKQMRQYAYPEPSATQQDAEWAPGLVNTGETNFTGYLFMHVQNWTGAAWANIIPPIVDQQFVTVPGGSVLDIESLWEDAGGWDTAWYPGGWYRVRVVLEDPDRNTLVDSDGTPVLGTYNFTILEPVLSVTNLTHENQQRSLLEYETGDTIDWINVSVISRNNTALSATITLDMLDASLTSVGWGPQSETKSCGTIAENGTCERRWDNSTSGYAIPYGASAGDYTFYWNVTMDSSNGRETLNNSISVIVHDVESNATGDLLDTRIFKPNSTIYTFNLTNPWSTNLTGVNVTINCPTAGFECNHTTTGAQTYAVGVLANDTTTSVTFNVSVNSTIASANYPINVTLEYKNPGQEFQNHSEIASATLEVRLKGYLEITDYAHPENLTRLASGDFRAFMNNTGDAAAPNAWLAYLLPSAWSITAGSDNVTLASMAANTTEWNNITAQVGLGAALGPQTVTLRSNADDDRFDQTAYTVTISANTTLSFSANQSDVDQGDTVLLTGTLRYDNGTAIAGANVSFGDETAGSDLGWNYTDSGGSATVTYAVPGAAALGFHTLNASYAGSATLYTNAQQNTTTIDVNQRPVITDETVAPSQIGFGQNVTFSATVTDDDAVSDVRYTVTAPNGTTSEGSMGFTPPDFYSYTFDATWDAGTYNVTLTANDSDNSIAFTSLSFPVRGESLFVVRTLQDAYSQNEEVNLSYSTAQRWWNASWPYRADINITNTAGNLTEYQVYVSRDLSDAYADGHIQEDCTDVRFTWYNTTAQREQQIDFFTDYCRLSKEDNATFWAQVPFIENDTTTNIHLYYGNASATNASNISATFTYETPRIVAYVGGNTTVTNGLDIVSYEAGNNVTVGTESYPLGEYGLASKTSGLTEGTAIKALKPFTAEGSGDVDDMVIPVSWASTDFVYGGMRDNGDRFCFVSPWGTATVSLYDGGSVELNSVTVTGSRCFDNDVSDGNTARITSDIPILVFHDGAGQSRDGWPFYPATTEPLYSPSVSSVATVAAGASGATITCTDSSGAADASVAVGADGEHDCSLTTGQNGTGAAWRVTTSNNPIGAIQQADSDGSESTTAVPIKEMGTLFGAPHNAEYVVAVTPFGDTVCNLSTSGGHHSGNTTEGTGDVYRINFGAGLITGDYITAPWKMECTRPVWAYYEASDDDSDETTMLGYKQLRQYVYPPPVVVHANTTNGSAQLYTSYPVNASGYVRLKVQRNDSGTWTDVSTIIDDLTSGQKRTFGQRGLRLDDLWNAISWNTATEPSGTYRAYAELFRPDGESLNDTRGSPITDAGLFTITPPDLQLSIATIRVFDVTDTAPANRHFYTNDFIGSGTNRTFTLTQGDLYRLEIDVKNTGTNTWTLNDTNISYTDFLPGWSINEDADLWYSTNTTLSLKRTDTLREGGTYNGNITWNISQYGGSVAAGDNATFFLIVNASSVDSPQVTFTIVHPTFTKTDKSILQALEADTEPPKLYQNTYGLTSTSIVRGTSTIIYGRWDETIGEANASYTTTNNVTLSTLTNESPQNAHNWTNFTITSAGAWYLGEHDARLVVRDQLGNTNSSAPYLHFNVTGLAQVLSNSQNESSIGVYESVALRCRVTDDTDTDQPITGYVVRFYNSTDPIGWDYTNSTGWATVNYTDPTPGSEALTCNITANASTFYTIDALNEQAFSLTTTEPNPPYNTTVNGPVTTNKGETIRLDVLWNDDFALDAAQLATNASGSYDNVSSASLSGTQDWANITYVVPSSFTPGTLGWFQEGNDTSGNTNKTDINSIQVWGWSRVQEENLDPGSISEGTNSTFTCRVTDANSTEGIAGYSVWFGYKRDSEGTYRFLGRNQTNGTGYARWTQNMSTQDIYDFKCNITDNTTLYYNDTTDNQGLDSLTVVSGADLQPPRIILNNYSINETPVNYDECFTLSGLWDESINYSYVRFNVTPTLVETRNISPPYTSNWTNVSICTNSTWTTGGHEIKLFARDQVGNLNDTLDWLDFTLEGRASVSIDQPTQDQDRGNITVVCNVTDADLGTPIEDYTVTFYDGDVGGSVGTNTTNASGVARLTYDTDDYAQIDVGPDQISCGISNDPAKGYVALAPITVSNTIDLYGTLFITVTVPPNGSILNRGVAEPLEATIIDENGNPPRDENGVLFTPTTTWTNTTDDTLATGNDTTWAVPATYAVGSETLRANASASYYHWGNDTVEVIIYGLASVALQSPAADTYPESTALTLACLVSDDGTSAPIAGYTVSFDDGGSSLGNNNTNSTGEARITVNTDSLSEGSHTLQCTIGDNATLFYNKTAPFQDSVAIIVDKTDPVISYNPSTVQNVTTANNRTNVNVSITEDNIDVARLNWNGTFEDWGTRDGTDWFTARERPDGNYSFYGWVNDTAGHSAQTNTWWVLIDTKPPTVSIAHPMNTTYNTTVLDLNYTATDARLDQCWYANSTDANVPLPGCANGTLNGLPAGANWVTIYANDTVGNTGNASVNFTIDQTLPTILLTSPVNESTYTTSNEVDLNFTVADNKATDQCWYRLDGGSSVPVAGCQNTTIPGLLNGNRSLAFYTNDTAGNVNQSTLWFNISITDLIITPTVPENNSNTSNAWVITNVTANREIRECNVSLNGGAWQAMLNVTGIAWGANVSGLTEGENNLTYSCSDENGADTAGPIRVIADFTPPGITYVAPTPGANWGSSWVYVNITTDEPTTSATLEWQNATGNYNYSMVRVSPTEYYYNLTGLSGGDYNYTAYATDTKGNTGNGTLRALTISLAAPIITITSPTNNTYTQTVIDLNVSASETVTRWYFTLDGEEFNFTPNTGIAADLFSNSLRVYAVDTDGLTGNASVNFTTSVSQWDDDFRGYTGLSDAENLSATGDATINECWPLFTSQEAAPQAQNASCWPYRRDVNLSSSSGILTDYQMRLNLNLTSLITAGDLQADCGDLRFSDSTGTTRLDHWIESCGNGPNTTVWVEVPTLGSSTQLYLYYGNAVANDASNGSATFAFFDDFTTVSSTVWGANANNWFAEDGIAYPNTTLAASRLTASGYSFLTSYITELRMAGSGDGTDGYYRFGTGTENLQFRLVGGSGQINLYNGGSNTYSTNSTQLQRYTLRANFSSDEFNVTINNTVEALNVSSASAGSTANPRFYAYYRNGTAVDWIGVRTFAPREPTVGALGGVETPIHNASATSITIAPGAGYDWNSFTADTTIPAGTNITFQLRNSTHGDLCGLIKASQVSSGYVPCLAANQSDTINLFANLTSTNGVLPELLNWNISWLASAAQADLNISDIDFSTGDPVETENVTITVNISNLGSAAAAGFTLELNSSLWNGSDWVFNESKTKAGLSLAGSDHSEQNFTWSALIGTYRYVADVDATDTVSESDESNNNLTRNLTTDAWEILYGVLDYAFLIGDVTNTEFYNWTISNLAGNMYFSDDDSSYDPTDLEPLGNDDYVLADEQLGFTGFNDSVSALFDRDGDGIADRAEQFIIAGSPFSVPVTNSTNSTRFITGIMFDSADNPAYTGNEDLVIVTKVNVSQKGRYGIYDYEVRVPATLGELFGSIDQITQLREMR